MEVTKVSIVVNSFKSTQHLGNCLKSLQKLNYPEYEIIVVATCIPNFKNCFIKALSIVGNITRLPCSQVAMQPADP